LCVWPMLMMMNRVLMSFCKRTWVINLTHLNKIWTWYKIVKLNVNDLHV
jgi:hypothetical protein